MFLRENVKKRGNKKLNSVTESRKQGNLWEEEEEEKKQLKQQLGWAWAERGVELGAIVHSAVKTETPAPPYDPHRILYSVCAYLRAVAQLRQNISIKKLKNESLSDPVSLPDNGRYYGMVPVEPSCHGRK